MASPSPDPWFGVDIRRRALRDRLAADERRWVADRRHPNRQRPGCLVEWDAPGVPLSLDLHGFDAAGARRVLGEFAAHMADGGVPTWGVIFGQGLVLGEVVEDGLAGLGVRRLAWYAGHVYVEVEVADRDVWPGCHLRGIPRKGLTKERAPDAEPVTCRGRVLALLVVAALVAGAVLLVRRLLAGG